MILIGLLKQMGWKERNDRGKNVILKSISKKRFIWINLIYRTNMRVAQKVTLVLFVGKDIKIHEIYFNITNYIDQSNF